MKKLTVAMLFMLMSAFSYSWNAVDTAENDLMFLAPALDNFIEGLKYE